MNLNERISKIIAYSSLSSSEFADAIDVQRSNISHITSGRNKPSLDFLIKIKDRFPELQWDWIIYGEGEMSKVTTLELIEEKPKPTSLPDLFSLINDENFGITESEDKVLKENSPQSNIPQPTETKKQISNSQPLVTKDTANNTQTSDNQISTVKRIVFFYDNGKFETFEP